MTETQRSAGRAWGRLAVRLAGLVLAALVIWFVYRAIAPDLKQLTWAEIVDQQPETGLLILSLAGLVATQFIHAFLWRRIAIDLGSPAPGPRETVHIYFVSSLGRYVPGKVWQIAGVATLATRFGMAAGRAAAASVIAQIIFLATGLLVLGLTLPGLSEFLVDGHVLTRINPLWLSLGIFAAAAAAVWVLAATPLGEVFRNALIRIVGPTLGGRLGNSVAVAEAMTVRNGTIWAAGYTFSWILLGTSFVLFVSAFSPVPASLFVMTGGTIAAAYLVGFLAIGIPAGIGVREFVMIGMLKTIGVEPSLAVLISISSRLWFTAAELLPLLFIPLIPRSPTANGQPLTSQV
ncbi:MAG: lysylphosphatidylglycerol synthase domain-containing protein [Longimicrobiales bacterium]